MSETYETLCGKCSAYLDKIGWKYSVEDGENEKIMRFSVKGNDLDMDCIIKFIAAGTGLSFLSPIPVTFKGDKIFDGLMAINEINKQLGIGSLDFDMETGGVLYNITNFFAGCTLDSDEIFMLLIHLPLEIVDKYNDKLLLLSLGAIDFQEFLNKIS